MHVEVIVLWRLVSFMIDLSIYNINCFMAKSRFYLLFLLKED
jgi:hypothetical protein